MLFNTVSYLKHNFKLKIDPKMCAFKILEKIFQKYLVTLNKNALTPYGLNAQEQHNLKEKK